MSKHPEFVVERICGIRHTPRSNSAEFCVKWEGYERIEDLTWENPENMKNNKAFEKFVHTYAKSFDLIETKYKSGKKIRITWEQQDISHSEEWADQYDFRFPELKTGKKRKASVDTDSNKCIMCGNHTEPDMQACANCQIVKLPPIYLADSAKYFLPESSYARVEIPLDGYCGWHCMKHILANLPEFEPPQLPHSSDQQLYSALLANLDAHIAHELNPALQSQGTIYINLKQHLQNFYSKLLTMTPLSASEYISDGLFHIFAIVYKICIAISKTENGILTWHVINPVNSENQLFVDPDSSTTHCDTRRMFYLECFTTHFGHEHWQILAKVQQDGHNDINTSVYMANYLRMTNLTPDDEHIHLLIEPAWSGIHPKDRGFVASQIDRNGDPIPNKFYGLTVHEIFMLITQRESPDAQLGLNPFAYRLNANMQHDKQPFFDQNPHIRKGQVLELLRIINFNTKQRKIIKNIWLHEPLYTTHETGVIHDFWNAPLFFQIFALATGRLWIEQHAGSEYSERALLKFSSRLRNIEQQLNSTLLTISDSDKKTLSGLLSPFDVGEWKKPSNHLLNPEYLRAYPLGALKMLFYIFLALNLTGPFVSIPRMDQMAWAGFDPGNHDSTQNDIFFLPLLYPFTWGSRCSFRHVWAFSLSGLGRRQHINRTGVKEWAQSRGYAGIDTWYWGSYDRAGDYPDSWANVIFQPSDCHFAHPYLYGMIPEGFVDQYDAWVDDDGMFSIKAIVYMYLLFANSEFLRIQHSS